MGAYKGHRGLESEDTPTVLTAPWVCLGGPHAVGRGPETRQRTAKRGPLHGRCSLLWSGEPVTAPRPAEPACRPWPTFRTCEYLPLLTPWPSRRPLPQQRTLGQLSRGSCQHWCPRGKGFCLGPSELGEFSPIRLTAARPSLQPSQSPACCGLNLAPREGAPRGAGSRAHRAAPRPSCFRAP